MLANRLKGQKRIYDFKKDVPVIKRNIRNEEKDVKSALSALQSMVTDITENVSLEIKLEHPTKIAHTEIDINKEVTDTKKEKITLETNTNFMPRQPLVIDGSNFKNKAPPPVISVICDGVTTNYVRGHLLKKPHKDNTLDTHAKSSLHKDINSDVITQPEEAGSSLSLVKHVVDITPLIPTIDKPYQCHICEGIFAQKCHLKRHVMTHTGERPFKCDQCDAAFITSSNLKQHIFVHTGERPYKCSYCKRGFTTSSNLNMHYNVHTGAKPFQCQRCNCSFSQQNNLKRHMKMHTNSKPCHNCLKPKRNVFNARKYMQDP